MTKHSPIHSTDANRFSAVAALTAHNATALHKSPTATERLFVTMPLADGTDLILCDTGNGWSAIEEDGHHFAKLLHDQNAKAASQPDMRLLSDIAAAFDGAPTRHVAVMVLEPVQDEEGTRHVRDAWLFCRKCHRWSMAPQSAESWPHACHTGPKAKNHKASGSSKLRLV